MTATLNPPQREAIRYIDGPLLVLAGAGSGKTRVITQKIAYLVKDCRLSPQNIAAITFTNKAAREMQERVSHLLPGTASKGLTISTFHSLGLQMLRHEARHLGYKPRFSILDSADALHILSDILKTTDKALLRHAQGRISLWKNALIDADQAILVASNESERQVAVAYRAYQDTLRAYQATDFDDLIRLPVTLFQSNPEVLEKWRNKLRYLLVDEYQDTNDCQYQLLKLICGERGMFTAVGDDDQAIYAWRGANADNLRVLKEDFPKLHLIKLEQNYRSTVRILKSANTLIANNPKVFEKKLWSDLGMGDPIQVTACKSDEHEAESVVMRLIAHKFENRTRFGDYAILYRGNHQARVFEQALRNQRVPYVLSGGTSFFEKAEIKDVISYLRLIANSDDDPAFIRAVTTPKRGVGAQTLEKLGTYAAGRHISLFAAVFETGLEQQQLGPKHHETLVTFCDFINRLQSRAEREPPGPLLEELLRAINYEMHLYDSEENMKAAETKWKNVQDFVGWLGKKGEEDEKNLLELTQTIALLNMLGNREDPDQDAVRMSTLHASKGLEYPHVFLVGVEEGILPHRESIDNGQVEEERRLMYVGVTRAQRSLTLSYALKRKRAGEWQVCEPSRFISELAQEDLRFSGREGMGAAPMTKAEGSAKLAQIKAMLQQGKAGS